MKPLGDCKLYTFVDTAYLNGRAPELVAQQLCDGGSDLIQLRAKKSSPDEIRQMAEKILPITKRANVGLVINDLPAGDSVEGETGVSEEPGDLHLPRFDDAGLERLRRNGPEVATLGAEVDSVIAGVEAGLLPRLMRRRSPKVSRSSGSSLRPASWE